MKFPLDPTTYPRDRRSRVADSTLGNGGYAYVRDVNGTIYVVPDGPHVHPTVLGGGLPAWYAGDMTIRNGVVVDLTNLSGTFQFDDENGLRDIANELRNLGLVIQCGAVRFFPQDGSPPVILE